MMETPMNVFMIYNKKDDELYDRLFNQRHHALNSLRQRAYVDEMDCDIREFELVEVLE